MTRKYYLVVRCPKAKKINEEEVDLLVKKYDGTFEGQYSFFRVYLLEDIPQDLRDALRTKGIDYNYRYRKPDQLTSPEERATISSRIGRVFTRIGSRSPLMGQVIFIRSWKEGRYHCMCKTVGNMWQRRNKLYDTTIPDDLKDWKERDLEFLSTFGSPHLVLKEALQTRVRELEKRLKTTQSGINKFNSVIEKM